MDLWVSYSPEADIVTLGICLLFLLLLRTTYLIRERNLSLAIACNGMLMAATLCSILYHMLVIYAEHSVTIFLIYLLRDAMHIILLALLYMFCSYVTYIVDVFHQMKTRIHFWLGVIFVVFTVLEIATPIFYDVLHTNKEGALYNDFLVTSSFAFGYILYCLVLGGLLFFFRKYFITKMYQCLCGAGILSVSIVILQSISRNNSFTCFSYTIPIVSVLFLFHYNSFDADTGMLDQKSFVSFLEHVKGEYGFIFLQLSDCSHERLSGLSSEFYHFNEQFFNGCITFRLNDDLLVLFYDKAKNPKYRRSIKYVLKGFDDMYQRFGIDFKIVLIESDKRLTQGTDYHKLALMIMSDMDINSVKESDDEIVSKYIGRENLLMHLNDIYTKADLEDPRIEVFCQPVLNVETGVFTTAEALMRLRIPGIGMVFPDEFIPLAEEHDFIHVFSMIIFSKTCKEVKRMIDEGYKLHRVSVNFSITELRRKTFCEEILRVIESTGVSAKNIAIELTESRNEDDFENVKYIMEHLHQYGIKFYLDDFGTGYSNFERIIGLPIDIIKFDRALTIMSANEGNDWLLVSSFADIFKKTGYRILFEGVEDEKDENRCGIMKADYLQGYKYSRPVPIAHLKDFLIKQSEV